ncbi:FxSxx-COOH system tetratricopeptide repeat protein [Actinoplanes sp. NPDC000266]
MTTRLPPDSSGATGQVSVTGSSGLQVGDHNHQINNVTHVVVEPLDPATVDASPGMHNLPRPAGGPFVGRDSAIADLLDLAEADDAVIGQTLHGLGGVGKTRLALQYAYSYRERYSLVWWINADTSERIVLGLADLAQRLLPSPVTLADAHKWAVRWLQERPGWLLVLDNVEDFAEIEPLLGQLRGRGRVLVTTRRDLGGTVWERFRLTPLRLTALDRASSVELLIGSSAHAGNVDDAAALAADLGDLPLALEQAAAYISQRHISIADYRRRLNLYPDKMFAVVPEGFPEGVALYRVWALTMETIADRSPFAPWVLRVLSFLAPDELPVEVAASLSESPMEVEDALALLASYSMITWTDDMLSVHRLVQEVTRLRPIAGESLSPAAAAVTLLSGALTADPWGEPSSWPRWNSLLPHIDAINPHISGRERVGEISSLLYRAATYLEGQGQYDRAIAMFTSVLTDHRRFLGDNDRLTLVAGGNLARARQTAGRAEEAIPLFETVFEGLRRVAGATDVTTLVIGDNLAVAYLAMSRSDDAILLPETILPIFERLPGVPFHDVTVCRGNLAAAYQLEGRLSDAIPLFELVREDDLRLLGDEHPSTLMAGNNLAQAYRFAERHDEAVDLYDEIVAISRRVMGDEHPDVLTFRKNQADLYRHLGRAIESIAILQAVLDGYRRTMGSDHPGTLICRDNLATAYQYSGRRAEAVAQFESILPDFRRVLGDGNPSTLTCWNNLAFALYDAGQFDEAAAQYEILLAKFRRVHGRDHPHALRIQRILQDSRRKASMKRRS